ncbi:MAG: hypothetical protein IPH23_03155 [Gammaproteobacteria bacterium]|nr:hypothetical protein [Gammaproteobacteria bacterium]
MIATLVFPVLLAAATPAFERESALFRQDVTGEPNQPFGDVLVDHMHGMEPVGMA